jgi:hypothetical protein
MAKSQTTREPSFSLAELNRIVGEQTLAALAKQRAEFEASVQAANASAKERVDYDALCIRAFKKAGFGDVKPRADVLTYNKWIEAGFKVKPGETAIRVKQLRLFHISQCVKMTKAEAAEAKKALEAKAEARTADRLPQVTLIQPKPATVAAPAKSKRRTVAITTQPTA